MPELRKISGEKVVPIHSELKIGTLKGILKLAKIDEEEFKKYL